MKKPAHYFRSFFGRVFDSAMGGSKWAHYILQFSKPFSSIPLGLWHFRKGDISKSLSVLSKARIQPRIATRYMQQGEEILDVLSRPISPAMPDEGQISPFNGRVLFACHSSGNFNLNGYAVRTAEITSALVNRGVEVRALTRLGYPWDSDKPSTARDTQSSMFRGLQYHHRYDQHQLITGAHSRYINAYAKYLEEVAKEEEVSVVHANSNFLNGLAAHHACSVNGWLSIYELRGLWHLTRAAQEAGYLDSEHFRFCEQMEIRAALMCDRVITLNTALKRWLCDRGVPAEKITIVPNGARIPGTPLAFEPATGVPVLGYAGALTQYEGIDDTLEAIALLKARGQHLRFLVAGHGNCETELRKLAERLGIADRVDFLGHISNSQLDRFYEQVDLIVLARKNLPVSQLVPPIKLVEAMSRGKAVITSDLLPLTEITGVGVCSRVANPDDPKALSEAIRMFVQSPELLDEMSRNAFQIACDKFSWEHLVQKYIDVYTGTDTINHSECGIKKRS